MAVVALIVPRAAGLIDMNEGRDKVAVTANYGISYDSNLDSNAAGRGDVNQSLGLGVNYTRRAGMIGFSAGVSVATARFNKYSSEDFTNPTLTMEFTKNDGRLTGAWSASAQRESRSDEAANLRANSWYYGSNLNLRYPVNDRYYFTSSTDVSTRDYAGGSSLLLHNLSSYSEALNLCYVYSSKLDLQAGYRLRIGQVGNRAGEVDDVTGTRDSAFTLGATGGILPKLSGTVSVGYQTRDESGPEGSHYDDLTTSLALAWPMSRQITFSLQSSKDFMMTATDISVDATAFDLSATVKPNLKVKIAMTADAGYTISRYLGTRGGGREDRALLFRVSLSIPLKSHFAASLSYGYVTNNSNFAFSKYDRSEASFNLSAHY